MTAGRPNEDARAESVVKQLLAWRDGLVREGRVPLGALKDTFLRNAVLRGRRDQRVISTLLPANVAHLAGDILEVILSVDTDGAAAGPGSGGSAQEVAAPSTFRSTFKAARDAIVEPTRRDGPGANSEPRPAVSADGSSGELGRPSLPAPSSEGANSAPPVASREELLAQGSQFAPLDYLAALDEPESLSVTINDGEVVLAWPDPPTPDAYSVYRLISGDDDEELSGPEFADLVAITTDASVSDPREFAAGVRHFQVWRNTGRDAEHARRRQPRLHAAGLVVAPIQNVSLTATRATSAGPGRVIGQWSVFPQAEKVHVYRIPLEMAAKVRLDPEYEILADRPNLGGFVDAEVESGRRYLYRFEVAARGTNQKSPLVSQSVAVPAALVAVVDLEVVRHGSDIDPAFELTWSDPPKARVVMYASDRAPQPGAEQDPLAESSLPQAGLPLDRRVNYPIERSSDGRSVMQHVTLPERWGRIYFTPVTLLEGRAQVGRTVSVAVVATPSEPVVVERTNFQLVKFGWPADTAMVAIGVTPRTETPQVPQPGPYYVELSRQVYDQLGCYVFPQRLRPESTVHLAGVSFVNGQRVFGPPVCTPYAGLLRLSYTVETKRNLMRRPERLLLRLSAERDIDNCPPFVLVHNPDRLPMHAEDGRALEVVPDVEAVTTPSTRFRPDRLTTVLGEPGYRAVAKQLNGYVRLFVQVPPDVLATVALLDPPLSSLKIGG